MRRSVELAFPAIALGLVVYGGYLGLVAAPPEVFMGDVYRIIFVHVPSSWLALVGGIINFAASLFYLFKPTNQADALAESAAELGVLFCSLALITGSIWGRPTWGVWWTWDPRLTTAAILWLAYSGYLALRKFVDVPEKRATWAAVVGIVIGVDIPIVWFSVKWWNSLHQPQSSPNSMNPQMLKALMFNLLAYTVLFLWFVFMRYTLARRRQDVELSAPPALHVGGAA
jgi:heme exporter protein C